MQLISQKRRKKNVKQNKNIPGGSATDNILASYGNKRQKEATVYEQALKDAKK